MSAHQPQIPVKQSHPAWQDIKRREEEELTIKKASLQGAGYVCLTGYPLEVEILSVVQEELVKKYEAIPYKKEGNTIKLAVSDTLDKKISELLKTLEHSTKYKFEPVLASKSSILYGLKTYELTVPKEQKILREEISFEKEIKHLAELKNEITKVPTTKIVDTIISGALSVDSSDIHIEPREKEVRIRYRIDGVLHNVALLSKEVFKPIIARIKFLSKLKMDITRIPQDGKFFVYFKNKRVDIRTSILPTNDGETVVMRLFGSEAASLQLERLGLLKEDFNKLTEVLKKTHGMILITGPTGSGKTTSLYAILNKLSQPEVKIITLEDPIEYHLENITQSQVDLETGYTFVSGLRSILRQDPDIVMVGEIRDFETAEMAVHAALTGHIVLSTLHTNDASGAIPRLVDIGVKPYLITQAINLIVAQRLVRKICPTCREKFKPSQALLKNIEKIIEQIPPNRKPKKIPEFFYRGKGCSTCNETGYKDRIGIFELMEIDENIENLILSGTTSNVLKKEAFKKGFLTMEQDGILKVISGLTTLEEVERVTRE
jgi:type II secretory ATPase GspE/PulE/Tfp pilus assembly ATPase PilB-like protein